MHLRLRVPTQQNCWFGYGTFGAGREPDASLLPEERVVRDAWTYDTANGNGICDILINERYDEFASGLEALRRLGSPELEPLRREHRCHASDNSESTPLIPSRSMQHCAETSRLSAPSKQPSNLSSNNYGMEPSLRRRRPTSTNTLKRFDIATKWPHPVAHAENDDRMTATDGHASASEPHFLRICGYRAALVLYGASLAVGPLFGYSSVPLFCAMVVLVISALALGARVRTVAVITAAGLLSSVAVLALKPYPKGPDGIIPILRHHYPEAQRPTPQP